MKRAWLVALVVVASCCPTPEPAKPAVVAAAAPAGSAQPQLPEEPAFDPPAPTLRLPRNFTPTKYSARLAIDPAQPDFTGEVTIVGKLDQRSAAIWLDAKNLTIDKAEVYSGLEIPRPHPAAKIVLIPKPLTVTQHGDYLELRPAQPLAAGTWKLAITYRGRISSNAFRGAFLTKYGDDPYVATQFESLGARMVFPCVDEPDRKTPWQLTLDVPKALVAVSNTPITGTTALDDSHVRVEFAPTLPLPSYLVAFAVGTWEVVDAGKAKSGLPLRIVTPRGTSDKVQALAAAEPKIVDFLETWFAIPFPYPKLDIVVLPSRGGGAMENAGMITTDARIVMYAHPSARDRYRMVSVIGHETAHQWFGDLVTAAWWDDIWLNESFATWSEDKILAAYDPSWPSEVNAKRMVLGLDTLGSARKIRQPIESEGDIANAFDAITYPKGGLVLRMIEHQIGEDVFQRAIRTYLAAHANGNATAADLFAAIDKAAGRSLAAEMSSFFDQPGAPEIAMSVSCANNAATVTLAQHRLTATDDDKLPGEKWVVPVCVAFDDGKGGRGDTCTLLDAPTAEVAVDHCPKWIAPSGTYGYFQSRLDAKALEAVRDIGWTKLTADERISLANGAADYARAGRIPLQLALSLVEKLRAGSPQELAAGLGDATGIGNASATGLPDGWARLIPTELRPRAEAVVRRYAEPLAKQRGAVAKTDEDVGSEAARQAMLGAIVWSHSHVLDAEAKKLVAHYRDIPIASRRAILMIAANADQAISDRLLADALAEKDPQLHSELLVAAVGVDDLKRHRAMIDKLVPDPKLTSPDLVTILTAGDVPANRDSEAYIRAHVDELFARLPMVSTSQMALRLMRVFQTSCEPARRDDVAAFLTEHFAKLTGGARPAKQAIESYDHCVTARRAIEPMVRTWLGAK
ncbi:MAG TPA: M1 family aminopeptidase [Kofleriaceae bacterium]|jgi:alanyl aminopeptidase|nr:M1 family aminopeptidase [Kofleriaceae bacterium]